MQQGKRLVGRWRLLTEGGQAPGLLSILVAGKEDQRMEKQTKGADDSADGSITREG